MTPPGPDGAAADRSGSIDARVVSLAQSFSERHRRGERPTVEEYAARHPELAAEIRELFPMLCVLEELAPAAPENAGASPGLEIGPLQQLGEYRLIREVGRGGMGVVYEAEQETLKRRVALKVLPFQAFQDQHQLERFRREAQAAARLHHTNIVPVFGVGEDRGICYYAMQFIHGQTLAQVLQEVRRLRAREGAAAAAAASEEVSAESVARTLFDEGTAAGPPADRTPPAAAPVAPAAPEAPRDDSTSSIGKDPRGVYYRSAARLALQVAEGLAYAHNEGILHRDIKPSNLLLDLNGTVWITDFGLAKVEGSAEVTACGSLVGTLRYMAPERFRGLGDARSDVYSLGVTLYELLTLRPAFAASDRAEVMRDVAARDPPPPRRLDPAIPRDLETVVLKAGAKEPKDRYPSAAAFADDLRRFLHHEPVSARRASLPERLWRWAQRNPAAASLTAVSALLLLVLAAGSLFSAARLRGERDTAAERLVLSKLEEGRAWRLSRKPGGRALSLAALSEAVTPETAVRVRNELIATLALIDLEEEASWQVSGKQFRVDDRLGRLVEVLPGGVVRVHEGVSGEQPIAELAGGGRPVEHLFLSPDGKYLATHDGQRTLRVWDIDRQAPAFQCRGSVADFDPAGSRFAHVAGRKIVVRGLPDGEALLSFGEELRPLALAFDPGGKRIAAAGLGFSQNAVAIYDVATGALTSRLHHRDAATSVAWHPGGGSLAVGCFDYHCYVWEVATGHRLQLLAGHTGEVVKVAFSHAGRFLATAGWDNRTLLWDAGTGDLITEAAGHASAFSADDRLLGFVRGQRNAGVWRLSGVGAYRVLHAPPSGAPHTLPGGKAPTDLAVSPEGRWLAAACAEEGARLWSLEAPAGEHRVRAGSVLSLRFHPDGSALWTAGDEGLFRWPLRCPAGDGVWVIGPPERLREGACRWVRIAADGRLAAVVTHRDGGEIAIHDLETGGLRQSWLHRRVSQCEFSPAGRWLVSTTFHGRDVRIWCGSDFSLAHALELGTARACFSPDERWLATVNASAIAVHEAGSWRQRFAIRREFLDDLGGPLAFSPDGRYLAAAGSRSLVILLRVDDGAELARFDAPLRTLHYSHLAFSPDQGLLVASTENHRIQIWDLRRVRRELADLGLDWSPEEPIPEPPRGEAPRLRVESGAPAARAIKPSPDPALHQREARQLLDALTQRVEIEPRPEAFLARAALLVRLEDFAAGLEDLDRALAAAPGDGPALALRAGVHERLGNREAALADADCAILICRGFGAKPAAGDVASGAALRDALRVRARVQAARGMEGLEGAWRDWVEVAALDRADLEACENVAWLWVVGRCAANDAPAQDARGGEELALACAETDYRARPENPIAARNLGAVLYHLGRFEKARPLLEKAWGLNRAAISAALHLAMAEGRSGQLDKAREIYDSVQAERGKYPPGTPAIQEFLEAIRAHTERVLEGAADAREPDSSPGADSE